MTTKLCGVLAICAVFALGVAVSTIPPDLETNAPLEFPKHSQNYTFVDNSSIRENLVSHSENDTEVEDLLDEPWGNSILIPIFPPHPVGEGKDDVEWLQEGSDSEDYEFSANDPTDTTAAAELRSEVGDTKSEPQQGAPEVEDGKSQNSRSQQDAPEVEDGKSQNSQPRQDAPEVEEGKSPNSQSQQDAPEVEDGKSQNPQPQQDAPEVEDVTSQTPQSQQDAPEIEDEKSQNFQPQQEVSAGYDTKSILDEANSEEENVQPQQDASEVKVAKPQWDEETPIDQDFSISRVVIKEEPVYRSGVPLLDGTAAGIIAGTFLAVVVFAYAGLIIWRRYLDRRYGSREMLVWDDPEDIKHFTI